MRGPGAGADNRRQPDAAKIQSVFAVIKPSQQLAESFRNSIKAGWPLNGAVVDLDSGDILAVGRDGAPVDDLPQLFDPLDFLVVVCAYYFRI